MKNVHRIVLFSGGIDSTLALAWALRASARVTTLEVDYPERPRAERRAADRITRLLAPPLRARATLAFPLHPKNSRRGYLATRNLLYHSLAQSLAESTGADAVVAGHRLEDAEPFPDARPAYLRRVQALAAQGRPGRRSIRILNPVGAKTEAQRVAMARRLDAPIDLAWSCWNDGARACGRCDKCAERRAFDAALTGSRSSGRRTAR